LRRQDDLQRRLVGSEYDYEYDFTGYVHSGSIQIMISPYVINCIEPKNNNNSSQEEAQTGAQTARAPEAQSQT
jgi:hypothetical protein